MSNQETEVVLYEENRSIKITRFFEVADYLTKNELWGEVGELLLSNELIGPRIVLDKHLGNAVKLVMARHASSTKASFHDDDIVKLTVRCGSMRTPRDPQEPIPSIPDR